MNACADFPTRENRRRNDKITKAFDMFSCAVDKLVLLSSSSYPLPGTVLSNNQIVRVFNHSSVSSSVTV